eukprot:11819969-Alexandrium_andersonii.AAC.1
MRLTCCLATSELNLPNARQEGEPLSRGPRQPRCPLAPPISVAGTAEALDRGRLWGRALVP